jgi:hypothetical protein
MCGVRSLTNFIMIVMIMVVQLRYDAYGWTYSSLLLGLINIDLYYMEIYYSTYTCGVRSLTNFIMIVMIMVVQLRYDTYGWT